MTTRSYVLSIDELRVCADLLGATLPALLEEFDTAGPDADGAGARALTARGLVTADDDGRLHLHPALVTLLGPLTDVRSSTELERTAPPVQLAASTDTAGRRVGFEQVSRHVWRVGTDLDPVAAVADLTTASETSPSDETRLPIALTHDAHQAVADLLAAGRHAQIAGLLAGTPAAAGLAAALADPEAGLGRLSRVELGPDGTVTELSCAWVCSRAGWWTVTTGDPVQAQADSLFVPADPSCLAEQLADVLHGVAEPMGV